MDKKALLGFKKPNLILNFIFLAIVVFVVIFFISSFFTIAFDTAKAESEIMVSRVLFSNNGFTYCDEICHPGIIDYQYFSNETVLNDRLSKAFNYTARQQPLIAFKGELVDENNNIISTSYFNKLWYDRWIPLTSFKQYENIQKSYYILYHKDNSLEKGRLDLDVVVEVE